jgi:hypothetical protein
VGWGFPPLSTGWGFPPLAIVFIKKMKFKSRLIKKEKVKIAKLIDNLKDYYGDFYITKNNLRLFIKENLSLLFDNLKKGDKIIYNENGIIIITGFSDNHSRKYIKFLSKDYNNIKELLLVLSEKFDYDLWAKLKKNNPLVKILQHVGFEWFANRGKECLLVKKNKGE